MFGRGIWGGCEVGLTDEAYRIGQVWLLWKHIARFVYLLENKVAIGREGVKARKGNRGCMRMIGTS